MKNTKILILTFFTLFFAAISVFSAGKVSDERQHLITTALKLTGTKYRWGGTEPSTGLDCSGFIDYAVREACGIQLPRTANAIYNAVEHIPAKDREAGDLVFFKNDMEAEKVTHVGIYCGPYHGKIKEYEGKRVFVSAVSDGEKTGVTLSLIDEKYWKKHVFGYGRILPKTETAEK